MFTFVGEPQRSEESEPEKGHEPTEEAIEATETPIETITQEDSDHEIEVDPDENSTSSNVVTGANALPDEAKESEKKTTKSEPINIEKPIDNLDVVSFSLCSRQVGFPT